MTVRTATLNLAGREMPFRFPDAGNMQDHLSSIFAGKDYPLPPLPKGYRIETIVDVGANVGAAALWFLGQAPEARLVCFEPSRENYECLRDNLAPFPNATAHHCGLFSNERTAVLHLGADQCMQHSIVASVETGAATETITLRRASSELDRLGLDRISILKVDTEGCEVAILEDLGPERLARVDLIYLEWHSEEDRRHIDALLAGRFQLAAATAKYVHRGNAAYMAAALVEQVPAVTALRLARPG